MSTLLVWKDQIEKIYAKYSFYILKVLQFALGLCVFGMINSNIGFMKSLSSTVCTVGLAAVSAFLPLGLLALLAAVFVLIQLYALSLPVAGLCLVIFLVMYILYIRFTPKRSWLIVVAALAAAWKVPYLIPVAFGLLGTPILALPAMCGVIVYYMLHTVKLTASAFQSGGMKEMLDGIMVFTKQTLSNKEMWMMAAVLFFALLIVYGLRTRGISHAWKTAAVTGAITAAALQVIGSMLLDLPIGIGVIVLDLVLAIAAGFVLEFFFLAVDYSRTETLQFEDDEYYYYVKAVPKVGVTLPEKQVKHITEPHENQGEAVLMEKHEPEELPKVQIQETIALDPQQIQEADLEKNVDELLLTQSLNEELRQNQQEPEDDLSLTKSLGELWTKTPGADE